VARREHRQRFWDAIAGGLSSEDAGVATGVSPAVGSRWFREGGGMPSISRTPLSGRYLSFAEREEIELLHAGGCSGRRARREACRRVGELGQTVAAVAAEFGVGWATVMAAVSGRATARLVAGW
jgi:hypothetical protein